MCLNQVQRHLADAFTCKSDDTDFNVSFLKDSSWTIFWQDIVIAVFFYLSLSTMLPVIAVILKLTFRHPLVSFPLNMVHDYI